jgi:hypothetical protein
LKAHSVLDIASKRSRISTLQTLLLITMYFDNEHSSEDNSMRWFVAGVVRWTWFCALTATDQPRWDTHSLIFFLYSRRSEW